MSKPVKIFDAIFWIFILILFIFLHLSQGRLSSDNGVFLAGAWSLVNHLGIYKDFFSFTAPGSYYLIYAFWKIFGISYWVAWSAALSALFISAVFVFKITVRSDRQAAYLAVLLFSLTTVSWPIITSHIFCLPFILSAVYLFIIGLEKNRLVLICLAGFLTGLATLFLQTVGLVTLAVISIWLLGRYVKGKDISDLKSLVGFIIFSSLPILGLFLKWSPAILFEALIRFPLANYSSTLTISYWLLSFSSLFLLVFFLILSQQRLASESIKLLFIWQLFLFFSAVSLPDFMHLSFVFAPLLMLFSILTVRLFKFINRPDSIISLVVSGGFFLYLVFCLSVQASFGKWPFFTFKNRPPEIITFLKENCQTEYIYVGPFLPGFYFETRKLTPGPAHWLITNHQPPEYFLETLRRIKETKPDCAVVNYEMVKKFNYHQDNPVDDYLFNNYRPIKQSNAAIIFRK